MINTAVLFQQFHQNTTLAFLHLLRVWRKMVSVYLPVVLVWVFLWCCVPTAFPPTRCSPRRAVSRHTSLQLPKMGSLLLPTTGHVLLLFTLCWLQSFLQLFWATSPHLNGCTPTLPHTPPEPQRNQTQTPTKNRKKKPGLISSVLIRSSRRPQKGSEGCIVRKSGWGNAWQGGKG